MTDDFLALRLHQDPPLARFERLHLHDLDPADVVVKVQWSSLNYKDALAITGRGKIVRRFPCVAGIDLCGEVLSSTDERFVPGQKVVATGHDLGTSHDGGLAARARLPGSWLLPLPPALSGFSAMALGTAGFSAALALLRLEHHGLRPGLGPVAVTGASGGVGSLAVALLASRGYEVEAISGKPERASALVQLGAARVIERPAFDGALRPLTTARWVAAIDNLGGAYLPWLLGALHREGAVASVGNAADAAFTGSVFPFILRGASVLGVDSAGCDRSTREQVWQALEKAFGSADMTQKLANLVEVVPLEGVEEACRKLVEGEARGRFVVKLPEA